MRTFSDAATYTKAFGERSHEPAIRVCMRASSRVYAYHSGGAFTLCEIYEAVNSFLGDHCGEQNALGFHPINHSFLPQNWEGYALWLGLTNPAGVSITPESHRSRAVEGTTQWVTVVLWYTRRRKFHGSLAITFLKGNQILFLEVMTLGRFKVRRNTS